MRKTSHLTTTIHEKLILNDLAVTLNTFSPQILIRNKKIQNVLFYRRLGFALT